MRLLRTPWVELRRERDGARVMETVVSYPGVKNCTAQRVMYIERPRVAEKRAYLALKRAFDVSGALVGLAVLALPMSVIALIIALDSPGDPIFRQERLGKDGKPFTMYKFRSMCQDAERDGPRWADADDGRCTRFGAFLRRTRLDELPQIWNILKGDMSFVGPRPERACFYRLFEEYIVGFSNRLNTILVPQSFMNWANQNFAPDSQPDPSRLIIEVDNPADASIAKYFQQKGYETEDGKLDAGKTTYFLRLIVGIVLAVGLFISILSFYILMLSIFLLLQKNNLSVNTMSP